MQRDGAEPAGRSARLVLTPGVAHLDPAEAVFRAMVDGWGMQQRTRFLAAGTISARLELVRRAWRRTVDGEEIAWRWVVLVGGAGGWAGAGAAADRGRGPRLEQIVRRGKHESIRGAGR